MLQTTKQEQKTNIEKAKNTKQNNNNGNRNLLVDLYPEAIIIHHKGKIVYVNKAAINLLGAKSQEDLLDQPIMEFVHPNYRDLVSQRIRNIYRHGAYQTAMEEKFLALDGTVIEVEVISLPFTFGDKPAIQIIVRDISERKKIEIRQQFLEKISNTLFVSFNDKLTLQKIAKLLVPAVADYCRIVTLDNEGNIQEIAVNHKSPNKVNLAKQLYHEYKNNPNSTHGIQNILKTKKAEIITKIDKSIIDTVKDKPKLIKVIKDLGLKSYMGVPLVVRDKILGAIILSSVKKNRYYSEDDLVFAQEIARRIALALDNARLYQEAQEEIEIRKNAEERLALAQAIGHIGAFEWNIKTRKFYWSKELEIIFGLSPGSFSQTYKEWEKLVHPADRKKIVFQAKKKRDTNQINEFTYRILRSDGSVRWIYSISRAVTNKKGKPVTRSGMMIDITEQMQNEINLKFLSEASKLLSSSLDFQTTLNNVALLAVPEIADWCAIDLLNDKGELNQVAIAHIDPKKIKWANSLRKTNPPDMNSKTGVANVIRTGKPEVYSEISPEMLKETAKNKKELKLLQDLNLSSVMIVPLYKEGKCSGAISFVASDSRRHYNKNDLAMAEELANRASLAIDSSWLYKQSQDAISLRDEFISVASHELKTPITSVKIFNQIIQQHALKINDERSYKFLLKMDRQLNKITDLIYNLLDISRIQSGRIEFNKKYVNVNSVIADAVDMMQEGTKHKIQVRGKISKRVYCDDDRLSQVIMNLISNGIKYSPSADKIIVHLKEGKGSATVCVEDFGIGMAKEHWTKVFDRFYRVYDSQNRTFPGLGIGLYISNEIIKRHNGKLWVESKTGKGSKFYVELPFPTEKNIVLKN